MMHPARAEVGPVRLGDSGFVLASPENEVCGRGVYDGAGSDSVWGFRGIMARDILPDRPDDRRRRSRLCALRAMDRLGLLGEGDLIPTLVRRPELRWLTDEEGARWAILRELGRIGEPDMFGEAVEWVLENHPSPEGARIYIRRLRARARRPHSASRMDRRLIKRPAWSKSRRIGPGG